MKATTQVISPTPVSSQEEVRSLRKLRTPAALLHSRQVERALEQASKLEMLGRINHSSIRCQILSLLAECQILTVSDLATLTDSKIALAAHHTYWLRDAGLVSVTRLGRDNFVRLRHEDLSQIYRALLSTADTLARICTLAPEGLSKKRNGADR